MLDTINRLIARIYELAAQATKFSSGQDLPEIEAEYQDRIETIILDYITSGRPVTSFRNEFRRNALVAFGLAAAAGWVEGGASGPVPEDVTSWVEQRASQEADFIDDLFSKLKDLRANSTEDEQLNFAISRAEGYTATLAGVFEYGKMTALKDRPGKWELGETEKHCSTCADLNGQVHPLSWYLDNGYIPRQSGSQTLECGGWNCDCRIVDPKTGEQLA